MQTENAGQVFLWKWIRPFTQVTPSPTTPQSKQGRATPEFPSTTFWSHVVV